jgi:hypothetical protein
MARWMIEIIDTHGNRLHLRHGATPGVGPIVQHRSKEHAAINVEMISPGLEEIQSVNIVPYDKDCE